MTKGFLDEDFMLHSDTARRLYHEHAASQPIVDYHSHISPIAIYEDRHFSGITELWLDEDRDKWRAMRAGGVPEDLVTGKWTDPYERFSAFASVLPGLFGSPLYHYSALELKRYFDIDTPLNEETAAEIYDICNKKLAEPDFSARNLVVRMGVEEICTTADPIDDLRYFREIRQQESRFHVRPVFCPDRAMELLRDDYVYYIGDLSLAAELHIYNYEDLVRALGLRLDFFMEHGCVITDHNFEEGLYSEAGELEVARIFEHRLNDGALTPEQEIKFKSRLLMDLAKEYRKRDLTMQIHLGALKNNNIRMYERLGPGMGFDSLDDMRYGRDMAMMLGLMDQSYALPKSVFYCLNTGDYEMLGSLLADFQDGTVPAKLQIGPAWWFTDHKRGMIKQLETLCDYGIFSRFIGMSTGADSLLSFTRHEYFRRVLCDFIGSAVEAGEYPADMEILGRMVEDISYGNAVRFLGL